MSNKNYYTQRQEQVINIDMTPEERAKDYFYNQPTNERLASYCNLAAKHSPPLQEDTVIALNATAERLRSHESVIREAEAVAYARGQRDMNERCRKATACAVELEEENERLKRMFLM